MTRLAACACLLVLLAGGVRAGEPPPSLDLLLYLADWQPDDAGRLIDPLDVPPEADLPAVPVRSDDTAPNPPSMENPR